MKNGKDFCKQYEGNCISCPMFGRNYCEETIDNIIKDLHNKNFIIINKEEKVV